MDAIEVIDLEQLQERVAELEARLEVARIVTCELKRHNAELEARLEVARTVYRTQKRHIAELEAQLAARVAA